MALTPGTRLGSYEILSALGSGGMGCVYRARDTRLGRTVAVKLMANAAAADPAAADRFFREALAASALNHPNIITVFEFSQSEAGPYLVTELIEGQTLRALIAESPPVRTVLSWCEQMTKALKAAHAAGIVHRDIKPDNIMVRSDGYVKVLDFGIARLTRQATQAPGDIEDVPTIPGTTPGMLLGTLRYMSPEQVRGESAGAASDIFSLALVWFELLTGGHPFGDDSPISTMHAVLSVPPVRVSTLNPEVTARIETLILQMLEKDPRLRPSAEDIERTLEDSMQAVVALPAARPVVAVPIQATVGREREMMALQSGFEASSSTSGRLICVAGEAGIGKTTIVENFITHLERSGRSVIVARGRCSERLAGTEAYLPFLESLDSLIHNHAEPTAHIMKLFAPGWYVQVASPTDPSQARLASEARAATPERLKRELSAFLREVSLSRPLVLFFDDLHWADASTIDLLVHAASQFSTMRILVIVTYRPSDMILAKHPFLAAKLSLQGRGVCSEMALDFLTTREVDKYLAITFPENTFPAGFGRTLHSRTDGNPLFVVDLVRYLRDQEVIQEKSGRWTLTRAFDEIVNELPVSVRSMVQRKIEQLSEDDRKLLAAGSVQGYEFDSAVVAEVLDLDPADAEERLSFLETGHSFVRSVSEGELPDGTLSVRYRFVHVLYQNALYASLRPTRKAGVSGAVAKCLESHLGDRKQSKASELALLFESARKPEKAAEYFLLAVRNAASVFASGEAAALARRGLDSLRALPDSAGRLRQELDFELALSSALRITKGNAAPETGESMLRALRLSEQLNDDSHLPALLWGLWLYYQVGGDSVSARFHAEQLLAMAQRSGDAAQLLGAHTAIGIISVHIGELAAGHAHLEQAVKHHDPLQHDAYNALYNLDPGVYSRGGTQRTLWLLGFPDQARVRTMESLTWSSELSDPQSIAFVQVFAAFFYQYCREPEEAELNARACETLCDEHSIVQEREWVAPVRGWAMAQLGRVQEGTQHLRDSLSRHRAMKSQLNLHYYLGLLASVLLEQGEIEQGLEAVEEGLDVVSRTKHSTFLAELYRLKGELLLSRDPNAQDAQTLFELAFKTAESQGTLSLQLRAAMSLFRACTRDGFHQEAYAKLQQVYDSFTEGFDTVDLREARALLTRQQSRTLPAIR